LKGFSYVRPTHGARWEWQVTAFGDIVRFDECPEEENNEEKRSTQEKHGA